MANKEPFCNMYFLQILLLLPAPKMDEVDRDADTKELNDVKTTVDRECATKQGENSDGMGYVQKLLNCCYIHNVYHIVVCVLCIYVLYIVDWAKQLRIGLNDSNFKMFYLNSIKKWQHKREENFTHEKFLKYTSVNAKTRKMRENS